MGAQHEVHRPSERVIGRVGRGGGDGPDRPLGSRGRGGDRSRVLGGSEMPGEHAEHGQSESGNQ